MHCGREGPGPVLSPAQDLSFGTHKNLNIMYTNAHSIVNKINELRLYILSVKPEIIAVTESWTNDSITEQYLSIPNYSLIVKSDRQDKAEGRGGRILIYVKDPIIAQRLEANNNFNQAAGISVKAPTINLNIHVI